MCNIFVQDQGHVKQIGKSTAAYSFKQPFSAFSFSISQELAAN
jgi:hypothetical protein